MIANTAPKAKKAATPKTKPEAKKVALETAPEASTKAEKPAKKPAKAKAEKPKKLSAINAAAQVMAEALKPLSAKELIEIMAEQGLWRSNAGATPHATLYSAILREIQLKGSASRFARSGQIGKFISNK